MDYSILSGSPLFKGLSSAEIEMILKKVPCRNRKFKSGSMISQSGERVNSLIVILAGVVKGEMVDYAGRVIKIEDIPAPGALAPAFLFGNKNRFPVNVIAITDSEILIIDKSDFLKILMNNDKMLINFLDMISNRSQFLSEKIKFLNFKTIKGKLAQYILRLAGERENEIKIDRTQTDLADFFGVTRPSVARALGEMEEAGYLLVKGKRMRILNREGLEDLTTE
jgi:CRP/FNR family transcriptional regulator, dissimilatory nitrate respiration regulator